MHEIEVVFENGVLRPLTPLPDEWRENERYTVSVEAPGGGATRLDTVCLAAAARDANPAVSLADVRRILAKASGTGAEAVAAEREDR